MKVNLNNCDEILFNPENGLKIKGIYDLYLYKDGKKSDEVIGVTFRVLLESPVFIDLDYVYIKVHGGVKSDFDTLNLSKRYIPTFKNLRGNIYNGKSGVMLSLEADSVDFEEV